MFGYEAHLEKLGQNPAQFPPNMLIELVVKGLEYKEMEANTRVEDLVRSGGGQQLDWLVCNSNL